MIVREGDRDDRPRYSLVVPAHNEAERIGRMLEDYVAVFGDSEIIVVLNGCTDSTLDVVQGYRERFPFVHMLEIPDPVGKGGAVRAGFLVARAAIIGYTDADGSTPAIEMRSLFEQLKDSDGLIASRWLPGSNVEVRQSNGRRVASRCFNVAVRLLFGLKFADTQCGAKVFTAEALEDVMGNVETSNLAFDVDLLFALKSAGRHVAEVPTRWIDYSGSRVQLVSASLRMFASLLRLRLRHSFLRLVVPLFDRLVPTTPVRFHDRLRILIINWRDVKHPQAGGAEAYLFEQAKRWVALGHHVEVLTAGFKGGSAVEVIDGIRVRRVGNAFTVYGIVPFVYLAEFRDRFDVVLDSENGIPFFTPLFSMKPKLCIVYHVHQAVFKKHLPALIAYPLMWCEAVLVPFMYRHARFVTISESTKKEMAGLGIPEHSVGLVYCGVEQSLVPGEKADVPTVVYLGRLKVYKRVDLLIRAFAEVLRDAGNAVLRIAGVGDARADLESLCTELGIGGSVVFEGFVDDDRKRELLQRAWVTVAPSEMEGWGISVIESNACGTPAIAFDVPGLSEAIVNGFNGLVVPEGSSLAEPMMALLKDDGLRGRLESGSLARAREFSWDAAADHMIGEMMQAIVGGEIRSIDLCNDWSLVKRSGGGAHQPQEYSLSSSAMVRPRPDKLLVPSEKS